MIASLCPHFGGLGYVVDLVASFSGQAALVTAVVAVGWVARQRWACAGVAAVAVMLHGLALIPGRASWAASSRDTLRVMQYNSATPVIGEYEPQRRAVLETDADVVSLVESMGQIHVGDSPAAREVRARYPFIAQNPKGEKWFACFLLSKWPVEDFPLTEAEMGSLHPLAVVVNRPEGAFGMLVMHPDSPRTATRWIKGNLLVESVGPIAERMRARGLPVVLAADLNSGPAGWRSRRLAQDGLGRCKPLWRIGGTFPSWLPWPARLVLDDVWVSADIRVTGWRATEPAGSDHLGVLAELSMPPKASVPQ